MLQTLSGTTRVYVIIGDPIEQVKSPAGVTGGFAKRGRDAVLVPIHVSAAHVDAFIDSLGHVQNVDGIIATVPHKFVAYRHCTSASDRAHLLTSVNGVRRNPDGTWYGDMLDGLGLVGGLRQAGCEPSGKRTLLVGAGGAGSAIALALLDAGVAELAIHDVDIARRDKLIVRLRSRYPQKLAIGSADPSGFALVVNATPLGMYPDDPLPVLADRLSPAMFVADVIPKPAVTRLLDIAQGMGCGTQTGVGMFEAQLDLMVDFLLASRTEAR